MGRLKELLEKLKWSHVVFIIGLAAGFFYYTLDQSEIEMRVQNIEHTRREIGDQQRKLEANLQFEREVEEKQKKYAELVAELQKVQGALPRQFFLPDLLSDLLQEASQLQVEIVQIKPDQAETDHELFKSLGFDITARGTFLQFFILLDRMANMKRLVNVQDFTVEKDTEGSRQNVTLGGDAGVFAGSKLSGGRAVYPGVKGTFRVLTYRYKPTGGGGG